MVKVLKEMDFKRAVNELIGNYFYLFSSVYTTKQGVPTNKEMLRVVRKELNNLFGHKVYLSAYQNGLFTETFTREYNLIVKGR